jgi:hypothetical protein
MVAGSIRYYFHLRKVLDFLVLSKNPVKWQLASFCLSICLLMTFDIRVFFEKLPRILKFYQNRTRVMGSLRGDVY